MCVNRDSYEQQIFFYIRIYEYKRDAKNRILSKEVFGITSHCILPGPFFCHFIVLPAISFIDTSDVRNKRVIWIRVSE